MTSEGTACQGQAGTTSKVLPPPQGCYPPPPGSQCLAGQSTVYSEQQPGAEPPRSPGHITHKCQGASPEGNRALVL